ncbi:MAG: type II secretion system F family protein, partial [Hyphomicrobiales bacterium]|nr:type II secretion system F family protein [Hyphomicrobiales bacterium]
MNAVVNALTDPQFMVGLLTAIAVFATIVTVAMPMLSNDHLNKRMKYVAHERKEMRARERARLNASKGEKVSLRQEQRAFVRRIVEDLDLKRRLIDDGIVSKLRMAGFRGEAPVTTFAFARFVAPFIVFLLVSFYLLTGDDFEAPAVVKLGMAAGIGLAGSYLPNLWLKNIITKRQLSIRRAWPDALDLMLICVESGMSIEAAFQKVSEEIGIQSPQLAEEMALTTAELSYLQERRQAYENLGKRTGLDGVKGVTTALIQAERYGTPLSTSLRVLAQENRDMRMQEAEKKAAALPP